MVVIMNEIVLFKDKWTGIIEQLKEKYSAFTSGIEVDREFDTDIVLTIAFDKSVKREDLLTQKFNEVYLMTNTSSFEELTLCISRMAGLCQVLNYAPAGYWFGLFCEEILEKFIDARYWYNLAAKLKYGPAMYKVGMLYLTNKADYPDSVSVKRCFTDALEHGVPEAEEILKKYF